MTYQLPINRHKKPFICGVDPDVDKSGLAIWSRKENKWVLLQTLPFAAMQETITNYGFEQIQIVVEAGWKNKGMHKHHKNNLPKGFETWTPEGQWGYMFQRGVDVGRNHTVGETLAHYLTANRFEVIEWQPRVAKWNAAELALYTGLKMRTNQEIRDAIRAVWLNK